LTSGDNDYRHFKGNAEGEEHRHDEEQVLLNVRRWNHAFGREFGDEAEHHAKYEETCHSRTNNIADFVVYENSGLRLENWAS
jgi:hypothetical protein